MADKINGKLILELRASGLSRNMIADTRHISRHHFSNVFHVVDEKEITYNGIRKLP